MEMTNAGHQEDDGVGGAMGEEVTTSAVLLGEPLPIELMNTVSADGGRTRDALADDTDAADWLRAVSGRLEAETGIRPGPLDAEGYARWPDRCGHCATRCDGSRRRQPEIRVLRRPLCRSRTVKRRSAR
ncbi:hypothetical protein [Actinacidiphila glaucinigra]|uniref:hypothetical protein n=1 Tax=Actinacidiphila glaucinigra TaxID=235986 RepID=UPI003D8EAEE1